MKKRFQRCCEDLFNKGFFLLEVKIKNPEKGFIETM